MVAIDPKALLQDLAYRGKAPVPLGEIQGAAKVRKLPDNDFREDERKGQFLAKLGIIQNYIPPLKVDSRNLERAEDIMFRANQLNSEAAMIRSQRPVDFPMPEGIDPKVVSYIQRQKKAGRPVANPAKNPNKFNRFVQAISGKESGGSYNAVNPHSGAMGRYQIMPANIAGPGGWDQEILGRNISTSQFMNNPRLQDKIARGKLRQYYNKYGVRGAASAWYSGDPNKWRNTSPQGGYPSIHAYVMDILRRMS